MKDKGDSEERFLSDWEDKRKRKWFYVFLHGSIYFGLTVALISALVKSKFAIAEVEWTRFLFSVPFYLIGGIPFGLWKFKRQEAIYLSIKQDKSKSQV